MSKLIKYLKVWNKRTFKLFPILLCFTVVILVCMMFILSAIIEDEDSSDKNVRICIGLVGDIEGSYLGIGITAVKEFDSSRFYVDFVPYGSTDQAEKDLNSGAITGYVYVPDDFVDGVIYGEHPKLTYVEQKTPASLSPLITREIISVVSDLVLQSRAGVYAMGDIAEANELPRSDIRDGEDRLNLRYFDAILSREEVYELNITGTGKGLGFADYYTLAFMLLILLIWGIICVPLFGTRKMELPRLLYSTGTGSLSQAVAEYLPFLLIMLINTLIMTLGLGLTGNSEFLFSGIKGFFYILPCVAVITAMQFFLYELTSNVISSVLVQLVATLSLAYACGLIYPSGSLPAAVAKIGDLTPVGACFGYMSEIFIQDPGLTELMPLVLYTLVFILASGIVRKAKIRRNTA